MEKPNNISEDPGGFTGNESPNPNDDGKNGPLGENQTAFPMVKKGKPKTELIVKSSANFLTTAEAVGSISDTPATSRIRGNEDFGGSGPSRTKSKKSKKKSSKSAPEKEADQELAKIIKTFGTSYWERGNSDDGHPDEKDVINKKQTAQNSKQEAIDEDISIEKLYSAATHGDVKEIKAMIKQGVDIEAKGKEKATAIHYAAKNDHVGVIKLLYYSGCDIDAEDQVGKTPLYWAAKHGSAAAARTLLTFGADRNSRTVTGWTALHTAARDGHEEVIAVLLEHKFDVDARSYFGVTPLFLAALKEHRRCLQLLLQAGANPRLKSVEGISPIDNAVTKGQEPMVNDLLNAMIPGLQNKTYKDMVFCLFTEADEFRMPELRSAVDKGNEEFVKLFLEVGVDLELVDDEGCTLLHVATTHGNFSIVELLLKAGANTERKTQDDGSTALLLAAADNRADLVELLLDNGANIEAKTTRTGRTALHIAANLANVETGFVSRLYAQQAKDLVKLLLKRGAYFGATDKYGFTPLQLAQRAKDQRQSATDVLLNPPAVEGRSGFEEPMPPASNLSNDEELVCQLFNAFLVDFDSPLPPEEKKAEDPIDTTEKSRRKRVRKLNRAPGQETAKIDPLPLPKPRDPEEFTDRVDWLPRMKSIHEVCHSIGPKAIMEEAHQNVSHSSQHLFRWIHVPANNIAWVKDLVHKICLEKESKKGNFEDMANFVSKTGNEHWGAMAHSRYMKTCFTVQGDDSQEKSGQQKAASDFQNTKLAIYMPFLNFDTTASRKEISDIIKTYESAPKTSPTEAAAEAAQQLDAEPSVQDFMRARVNTFTNGQSTQEAPGQARRKSSLGEMKSDEQRAGRRTRQGSFPVNPRRRSPGSSSQHRPTIRALDSGDPYHIVNLGTVGCAIGHKEKYKMLLKEYLSHRHGSIHISRTLDQFYYNSIGTATRDQDQVVYRFSKRHRKTRESTSEDDGAQEGVSVGDPEVGPGSSPRLHTRDSTNNPHLSSVNHIRHAHHDSIPGKFPFFQKRGNTKPVAASYSGNPRIFTVDQMWIWVIDEETIISSFPQRWGEESSQEPKVLETIQAHLGEKNRPQVKNVYEMAALITSHCIKFADKCSVKGDVNGKDFEESFLQIYASAVSNEADREARLFKKFQDQILAAKDKALNLVDSDEETEAEFNGESDNEFNDYTKGYRLGNHPQQTMELKDSQHDDVTMSKTNILGAQNKNARRPSHTLPEEYISSRTSSTIDRTLEPTPEIDEAIAIRRAKRHAKRKLEEKSDISGEIEVLKEIKDIRDELNILHRILDEQKSIADKLFDSDNRLRMSRNLQEYYFERSGLERRIQDLDKMDKDAERTYQHVNNLLDLKQKQANIDEALAGAEQGRIAVDQGAIATNHAKIAADQGAVVLIFTLVTIIFLPMSFLTSLYALNIGSFPHDDKGDLAYPSRYLFSRLFGISTGIAVVLVTLAFQVRRIRRLFKRKKTQFQKFYRGTPPENEQAPPRSHKQGARSKEYTIKELVTPRNSFQLGFRDSSEAKRTKHRVATPRTPTPRAPTPWTPTPSPRIKQEKVWSTSQQGGGGFEGEEVHEISPENETGDRTPSVFKWTRNVLGKKKLADVAA